MFWHEEEDEERGYRAPQDVFDLVFKLRGSSMRIDHAFALANSLRDRIDPDTCRRIGVHGIRIAASGNGWMRPDEADAQIPLSRRARLVIRLHQRDRDQVMRIVDTRMDLEGHEIEIGDARERELSTLDTLFARAVVADPEQSETDFQIAIAAELQAMGIAVSKMLCGRSGGIRTDKGEVFTRALMVAGLKPKESVELQRRGVGDDRLLGCGLFVPHKGIDAVFDIQDDA